jgi:hypothetical protein
MTWQLPGYEVLELVGFGGSGEVWRARVAGTGEEVALKRLRGADAVARERLRREAAVLSSIAGEHVVRVRDVVLTGTEAVLVMDYAAGGSLATVVAVRRQLTGPEVVTLVAPLAMALADAHERDIVHGDVTPANILFTVDGRPLLSDFGVARAVGTVTDVVEGTPPYLAPELLVGQPVSPAADVYALCKVAAEVLAVPSAPAALVAAVRSGLAGDPHDRPGARELASAVLRSCAAAPVGLVRVAPTRPSVVTQTVHVRPPVPEPPAPEPPSPARSRATSRRKPRRRRPRVLPRLVGSLLGMAALLLAVAGGVMWGHHTSSAAATVPALASAAAPAPTAAQTPPDWRRLVAQLEAARADALTRVAPGRLDAVYAPRSRALELDTAVLAGLMRRGLHPVGLAITTVRVEPVIVMPDEVTLRVTDALSPYTLVDRNGRAVAQLAARPDRTFTMLLVRAHGAWRIEAVRR